MRRMSFALTKDQVLNHTKTVTRRNGWTFLQPGDVLQPVEKCMGLKKGEKQQLIGRPIRVISVTREPLYHITAADVIKEGFPEMSQFDFVKMYCKATRGGFMQSVTRIEFEYL